MIANDRRDPCQITTHFACDTDRHGCPLNAKSDSVFMYSNLAYKTFFVGAWFFLFSSLKYFPKFFENQIATKKKANLIDFYRQIFFLGDDFCRPPRFFNTIAIVFSFGYMVDSYINNQKSQPDFWFEVGIVSKKFSYTCTFDGCCLRRVECSWLRFCFFWNNF